MSSYDKTKEFLKKYPGTVSFRTKEHCKILDKYINPDESIRFVFTGQKNTSSVAFPNTFVIALTDKRLLFARKRMLFGYFFYAITPDMFNDLKVKSGLIWGKIEIDTVKERVVISNLSKDSLDNIETVITQYMIEEKRKYAILGKK